MSARDRRVVVVGSGAGGAVTALELARSGFEVTVLEEGGRHGLADYGGKPTTAMQRLYRRRGMTPILGRVPIGYVEGRCVGGSTEINSGFWHRAPREVLQRWRSQYELADSSEQDLAPHYAWAEQALGVAVVPGAWPPSTRAFARGVEAMGWSFEEVPRAAPGCRQTNTCAQGCPTGAKQGVSRSILPQAESLGARVRTECRAVSLERERERVRAVLVRHGAEGSGRLERIEADHVFVCAGPTETPALLRRSGIRDRVGDSLRIHPYLKVAARFPEQLDAAGSVLPLLQVKEFWPDLSFGGAYFTPGHLAMTLGENWTANADEMRHERRMAQYYVGVRGSALGSVRPAGADRTSIRYELSRLDARNLSVGLARLSTLLLAGGAEAVFPSVYGIPSIRAEADAARWLDHTLPPANLSLVTVHAFSSCPCGERRDRCATDSFGRVFGFANLYVNDASLLPDSAGVNPQGTVMAMARRNALRFAGAQAG